MFRKMLAGSTSQAIPLFIRDTSSATGAGLSGLVFNTAGLVAEYRRQGQSSWTTITLQATTLGTWASGGFVADGALGGSYELSVPDAAIAAGAQWVRIRLRGAANLLPTEAYTELDAVNYQDAVRMGLSALPNAGAGASGGLPTGDGSGRVQVQSGTSAGQVNLSAGNVNLNMSQALPGTPADDSVGEALVNAKTAIVTVNAISAGAIAATSFAAGAIDSNAIAANAIGASELAADAVTEIAAGVASTAIEGAYTLEQLLRLMAASLLGEVSGITPGSSGTASIRNILDTKVRATIAYDANTNRTALTIVDAT